MRSPIDGWTGTRRPRGARAGAMPGRSPRCAPRTWTPSSRRGTAGCSSATPQGSSIRSRVKASTSRSAPGCSPPQALATTSPARTYTASVRDELHEELRRAARLKAGFYRPRFTRLLIDALNQSGAIRDVMIDLVAGRQTYRGLKRRLLGTFEIGTGAPRPAPDGETVGGSRAAPTPIPYFAM